MINQIIPQLKIKAAGVLLYGSSLVLRIREPNLERPFKTGNLAGACALGVIPVVLIIYALWASRDEQIVPGFSALLFAFLVAMVGPILYWLTTIAQNRRRLATITGD